MIACDVAEDATALRNLIAALVRRFSLSQRADVLCCGMTVAQAALLEALADGRVLRLSELATRLGITPSTLTRNLERLEEEGLVARAADPDDARAALVRLTSAGKRAADKVAAQEAAFAADVVARLGKERARVLVRALGDLWQAVRAATEECCPGAFDHLMEGAVSEGCGAERRSRERKSCCGS